VVRRHEVGVVFSTTAEVSPRYSAVAATDTPSERITEVKVWRVSWYLTRRSECREARYLLGYRRDLKVKLSGLRSWITDARENLDLLYPLAHERPWVGEGQRIFAAIQSSSGLPEELWAMWVADSGQILLTAPAESFLERVDFEEDE
jgi:hypothetical protein